MKKLLLRFISNLIACVLFPVLVLSIPAFINWKIDISEILEFMSNGKVIRFEVFVALVATGASYLFLPDTAK